MSEFKNGDKVWVSDISEAAAKEGKLERFFVGMNPVDKGYKYVTVRADGQLQEWMHAVKAED